LVCCRCCCNCTCRCCCNCTQHQHSMSRPSPCRTIQCPEFCRVCSSRERTPRFGSCSARRAEGVHAGLGYGLVGAPGPQTWLLMGAPLPCCPARFGGKGSQTVLTLCLVHMLAAWRGTRATCAAVGAAALVLLLLLLWDKTSWYADNVE
jgi:hypothetical protein